MYHVHVYFPLQQLEKAQTLNEIIRQERQDVLRVYPLVDRLVGPHKMPMFEMHLESISEEFLAWLDTIRGDFSVLIHPVSERELRDHTESAIWLGRKLGVFEEKLEN
ncbi:DOPA 4,5-dioxygenase [Vibrio parahaemolyticus]|uniref:DOPA 4,5-dioxygenase family protein n=1 Tax=Vibrio parahaemolyticus TaxID=670 RepID=UPI00084BA202|nr:DOPA 4,5-dioxygenase family protein [Vibrio parahaemolyticus]EGQ9807212.1 DOPA 4,5-dioxygenase [Vibrio parahaemolyticus]EJG0012194.1 DOPA 4,5-dioxygenase family protein [Vibrio parahaemolyticus]EJS9799059.1 DOPA 4,5-dioxygenase family protein [Vibrio parahaemolyticus]ODW74479.1 DOPA 4,5-dioxygenase [Vibrio parahaemolyticus]